MSHTLAHFENLVAVCNLWKCENFAKPQPANRNVSGLLQLKYARECDILLQQLRDGDGDGDGMVDVDHRQTFEDIEVMPSTPFRIARSPFRYIDLRL